MSLMDALLLDDYQDDHDVWATPRKDGLLGSGTANDPLPLIPPAPPSSMSISWATQGSVGDDATAGNNLNDMMTDIEDVLIM